MAAFSLITKLTSGKLNKKVSLYRKVRLNRLKYKNKVNCYQKCVWQLWSCRLHFLLFRVFVDNYYMTSAKF